MSDFFNHYKIHNGFIYNRKLTPWENFEKLISHLKIVPKSKGFYSLLSTSKCEYYLSFFDNFIHSNGFIYILDLSSEENFSRLIEHMRISRYSRCYSTLHKKFHGSKFASNLSDSNLKDSSNKKAKRENIIPESSENEIRAAIEKNEEMLFQVKQYLTVEEFFGYFETNYEFPYQNESANSQTNARELFNKLTEFMQFDAIYYRYKDHLNSFSHSSAKEDFLIQKFKSLKVEYDPNCSFAQSLNYLATNVGWKFSHKFLEVLNQIIQSQAASKFEKLEDLKKILIRYGFYNNKDEIPNKISELKDIIKKKLFVNIYDFIIPENIIQFKDIFALSKYTWKNKLNYPLQDAKNTFSSKVLLKKLIYLK